MQENYISNKIHKTLKIIFIIVVVYAISLKLTVIPQIPIVGDEIFDMESIETDIRNWPNFFESSHEHEDARLPLLISAPLVALLGIDSLIPTRLLFLVIHSLFLWTLFETLRLRFPRSQCYYFLILVISSCYLFSFSLFTMTSSNNLFLLFSTLMVYYYWKYFENQKTYPLKHIICLSLIIGLATASRLHGAILLMTLAIYDIGRKLSPSVFSSRNNLKLLNSKTSIICAGFTLLVFVQPLLNYDLHLKFVLLLIVSAFYLAYMYFTMRHASVNDKSYGSASILTWLIICHLAFNFTIIFSPTYLNINNILNIFIWFTEYNNNTEHLINPSIFDISNIMLIKFGLWSSLVLLTAFVMLYRQKTLKTFFKNSQLLWVIFVTQFILMSFSGFVLAWYPIPIFYYLYLPISTLIISISQCKNDYIKIILCLICISIPVHEQMRYLKLWPYGHIDGYQHGRQHIGWSKSGFITYEFLSLLEQYFEEEGYLKEDIPTTFIIDLYVTDTINKTLTDISNYYFHSKGYDHISFINSHEERFEAIEGAYFLTSYYSTHVDLDQIKTNYVLQHTLKIQDIAYFNIWKPIR